MSTTTLRLRKTLVILVSLALLLLPNLIAFADNEPLGEQGTPTPATSEEVSVEPSETVTPEESVSPEASEEVSEEPTEPTPAPSEEADGEKPAPSEEVSEEPAEPTPAPFRRGNHASGRNTFTRTFHGTADGQIHSDTRV